VLVAIMNAVIEHGTPLADDPRRVGRVRQLGIDETSFLAANRRHATIYANGLVDLERHAVIAMIEGTVPMTCVDGSATPILAGSRASGLSPRISPRASAPDRPRISITPAGSPIRFMSCVSEPMPGQGAPPSAERDTGPSRPQARPPSIESASCCSPGTNASTPAAVTACC
jgi:hypothetical protein